MYIHEALYYFNFKCRMTHSNIVWLKWACTWFSLCVWIQNKMCRLYLSHNIDIGFEGGKHRYDCRMIVFGCQVESSFAMLKKNKTMHSIRSVLIHCQHTHCSHTLIHTHTCMHACIHAQVHTWFNRDGSARHFSKVFTVLPWPFWLARCSGVNPLLLITSTKKKAFSSAFTMSLWPFHAASCRAVFPN